jgi:hypothetical protein
MRSAEDVAQALGVPAREVYKTLVVLPLRGSRAKDRHQIGPLAIVPL